MHVRFYLFFSAKNSHVCRSKYEAKKCIWIEIKKMDSNSKVKKMDLDRNIQKNGFGSESTKNNQKNDMFNNRFEFNCIEAKKTAPLPSLLFLHSYNFVSMYVFIEVCIIINKWIFVVIFFLLRVIQFVCFYGGGSCLKITCSTTLNNNKKKMKRNKKLGIQILEMRVPYVHVPCMCDKCEFGTFLTSWYFFFISSSHSLCLLFIIYY